MSIVGKVQVPGEQNPALITSTLFGRCTTAANDSHKVVTIANDAFSESFLMDGMSLKVFFENGNICDAPDLTIKTSGGTVLVQAIPIRGFHIYIGEDHSKDMVDCNYVTMTWTDGGVISFTYMRRDSANAGTNGFTYGDYWLIDNQALDSNYAYGYQSFNTESGKNTYFVDAQYGVWDHSVVPYATLVYLGYQNPNIKSGRYIYAFDLDGNGAPTRPAGDGIQGILEVIHCDTQAAPGYQNNYVIENFTFYNAPDIIYRRMWAEPASGTSWHDGAGWSNWYKISAGGNATTPIMVETAASKSTIIKESGYTSITNNTNNTLVCSCFVRMQGSNPSFALNNTEISRSTRSFDIPASGVLTFSQGSAGGTTTDEDVGWIHLVITGSYNSVTGSIGYNSTTEDVRGNIVIA